MPQNRYAYFLIPFIALVAADAMAQRGHLHDPGFCAVSPDPTPFRVAQPDGSSFSAVQRGAGAAVYLETADGYTVLPDPRDGSYRMAVEGPDGGLLLTEALAADAADRDGEAKRVVGALKPHARLAGAPLRTVVDAYEARLAPQREHHDHDHDGDGPQGIVKRLPGGFPSLGTHRALMLLIDFPDMAATYTVADVDRMCNQEGYSRNGQTGSFRDYYRDASYGQLTVDTEVQPWATAAHPRAHYGVQDIDERDYFNAPVLVREAVDAAEARGLDFAEFDGDDDGDVDMVLVIHAGRGAEESRDGADIWSHRWGLGAQRVTYDGVRVNDYIIQPEIYRGQGKIANIGVLVHEFGHALGLPDLYDTDGSSGGVSTWCVMASGTWANSGRTPTQPSAWCKAALGWSTPAEVGVGTSVSHGGLLPTGRAAGAYQLLTDTPGEYFLVESRERAGWDAYLPSAGVLVYHVDESRRNNSDEDHRWVDVEQADGQGRLYQSGGRADATDVFGTADARRTLVCDPEPDHRAHSLLYDGRASGILLDDIRYAADGASFDVGDCRGCRILEIAPGDVTRDCEADTYTQSFAITHDLDGEAAEFILAIATAGETYRDTVAVAAGATVVEAHIAGLPFGTDALSAHAYRRGDTACQARRADITEGLRYCVPNDDVCDAADVTAALLAGATVHGTTVGYTTEPGEPVPALAEWSAQRGWGEVALDRSAWFKFEAPASGHVDVDFGDAAVQAAIWEANTCADVLRDGQRLGVAAADDKSASDYGPHLADVRCLVPGETYYLQVDSEFRESHEFSFVARVGQDRCRAIAAEDEFCGTATAVDCDGAGLWTPARTPRGTQVVAAYNDRRRDLGAVSIRRTSAEATAFADVGGRQLASIHWRVDVPAGGTIATRLYLTAAEWEAVQRELGVATPDALELRRYTDDACGLFAAAAETLRPTFAQEAYNGEDLVLQFELPGAGNYALSSGAPMPVTYVDVAAFAKTRHNLITWRTADELGLSRFAVEARTDGSATWEEVGAVHPAGGGDYALEHRDPQLGTYYRIRNHDVDGASATSAVVFVARAPQSVGDLPLTLAPNPATDLVEVGVVGVDRIEVRDLRGALVHAVWVSPEAMRHQLELAHLSSGTYVVSAAGVGKVRVARLVVRR